MERLTERTCRGTVHIKGTVANYSRISYECQIPEGLELLKKALEKLAEYEDAEENGLLVRLPCKIGDTVFEVFENLRWDEDGTEDWFEHEILEKPFEYKDIDEIGKTVFLTEAKAEEKLKEMEGEDGD